MHAVSPQSSVQTDVETEPLFIGLLDCLHQQSLRQQRQMASTRPGDSAEEVKPSAESCSSDGHGKTAEPRRQVRSKTAAARDKVLRCADCGQKFDGWRMLQQHKRKSCAKSSVRFSCRECKAFFPSKTELNGHVSAAHESMHQSKKTDDSQTKSKHNSASCSGESVVSLMKGFKDAHGAKWKKALKQKMSSDDLKKLKSALAYKAAKRGGKLRESVKSCRALKEAVVEACTIGGNPYSFTTSCAPDTESFQFLCQSCLTIRFATYAELREHEDWCARVQSSPGFLCIPCGRHYRTLGTLRRHADEYHKMSFPSEVKKMVGNPFQFSTTVALDAASHPHACASCLLVCFANPTVLRKHEDWCGQCVSTKGGSKCDKCGRCFRTDALLERHTAADDCLKVDDSRTTDDLKINGDAESDSTDSKANVKQKLAPGITVHGVCPLCDLPFISQYEQQVHFMNVHSLTCAELKIKRQPEIQSRRGYVEKQVTCLDCDRAFSSRLELVQHKRECAKDKKFTKIILPVNPRLPTSGKNGKNKSTVKDGNSTKKEFPHKTDPVTTSASASGKSTLTKITAKDTAGSQRLENSCGLLKDGNSTKKEQRYYRKILPKKTDSVTTFAGASCKSTLTELHRSRSEDMTRSKRLQNSRGLLLNTAKVRNLIKSTGARQLLLKADGELVLLGDGDRKISAMLKADGELVLHGDGERKISAVDRKRAISKISGDRRLESRSGCSDDSSKPGPSEKPDAVTSPAVGTKSLPASSGSDQPIDGEKLTTDKYTNGKHLRESRELVSSEKDSVQNGDELEPSRCKVDQTDQEQHPSKVNGHKGLEAKRASEVAPKTDHGERKLTRKRPLRSRVTDGIDSGAKKSTTAAPEVGNSVAKKEPVLLGTGAKTSPENGCNLGVKMPDLPPPASSGEVGVEAESSSEADDGQQSLLGALQLVPVLAKLNQPATVASRYRTRSQRTGANVSEVPASKKRRRPDNVKDSTSGSSNSTADEGHALEPTTKTVSVSETGRSESTDKMHIGSDSLPQKTWTVAPVGDSWLSCVECRTVFQTTRQIVDHVCSSR